MESYHWISCQFPHVQKTKTKRKNSNTHQVLGVVEKTFSPKTLQRAKDARLIQFRKEERATYHDRRHGEEVRSLSSWPGTLGSWGLALRVAQWSGSWHIQPPAASRQLPPPPLRPISRGHTPPLAHKVGQTKPWTQFSLSQFLLSHLFLGSNPLETKFGADFPPTKKIYSSKKRKEKKNFGRSRSVDGPLQVRPCGAFGPARCCVVAAPELSSQSWDQSAETARRISLRGATWLVPRSKKVVGGGWGIEYVRGMLDCFSWENSCWN